VALTLSEKLRWTVGGKKFMWITVTHDESTSSFTAASVDLTYFEAIGLMANKPTSAAANTSTLALYLNVSITNGTTGTNNKALFQVQIIKLCSSCLKRRLL
jgi:hypothetical protein